jgi:small subunit ribosomal protein S17
MKQLTGTVIHTKMAKTAKVQVIRRWAHPLYKKILTKKKNYLAHCEIKLQPGDRVVIQESKPISKKKRWRVVKKI